MRMRDFIRKKISGFADEIVSNVPDVSVDPKAISIVSAVRWIDDDRTTVAFKADPYSLLKISGYVFGMILNGFSEEIENGGREYLSEISEAWISAAADASDQNLALLADTLAEMSIGWRKSPEAENDGRDTI